MNDPAFFGKLGKLPWAEQWLGFRPGFMSGTRPYWWRFSTVLDKSLNIRRNAPQRSPASYRRRGEKRLRVLPLAAGAIAITCASMGIASGLLHDVTKKPGVDIIKDGLHDIGTSVAPPRR